MQHPALQSGTVVRGTVLPQNAAMEGIVQGQQPQETPINGTPPPASYSQRQQLPPPTTPPRPVVDEAELQRVRSERDRISKTNEQLVARLQEMSAELQRKIDGNSSAATALKGTPGYKEPTGGDDSAKSKFFKFVDEVREERNLKEEVEVLRSRLVQLTDNTAEVQALQLGLEVVQGDYHAAAKAKLAAEDAAKRALEESRMLRLSLEAYERDAAASAMATEQAPVKDEDDADLEALFGGSGDEKKPAQPSPSAAASNGATASMVAKLRGELLTAQQVLSKEREAHSETKEHLEVARDTQRAAEIERDNLEVRLNSTQQDMKDFVEANEKLEGQLKRMVTAMGAAQDAHAGQAKAETEVQDLQNQVATLRAELIAERDGSDSAGAVVTALQAELGESRQEVAKLKRSLNEAEIAIETMESQEAAVGTLKKKLTSATKEAAAVKEANAVLQVTLDRSHKELDSTRKLLERSSRVVSEAYRQELAKRLLAERMLLDLAEENNTVDSCADIAEAPRTPQTDSPLPGPSPTTSPAKQSEAGAGEVAALREALAAKTAELEDSERQRQLDQRKAQDRAKELQRVLTSTSAELSELRSETSAAMSAAGDNSQRSLNADASGGSGPLHIDPVHDRTLSVSSSTPPTQGFLSPVAAVSESGSRVEELERLVATLTEDNERKGSIITEIVKKHPEVVARSQYAGDRKSTSKVTRFLHRSGFGQVKACTPAEYHNLQQVLERTLADNMRLTKDVDVLSGELERLTDKLAQTSASS